MFQRQGAVAFKKDLTNIKLLCDAIGNPENKFKAIHVAGTNGKGTTSHILSSIFQAAGYQVGLYTSPHYLDLRERIKINRKFISETAVIDFVNDYREHINNIQPSFFELMVAIAFNHFAKEKVDLAIIETGLGGRLDSTNIIDPMLSVITNISYDHQDLLGETLPEIATEKAGIIKKKIPVVIGEAQEEVRYVFEKKANELDAKISFADKHWKYKIQAENIDHYQLDIFQNDTLVFENIKVDLKGEVFLKNMITALESMHIWNESNDFISKEFIQEGLSNIKKRTYFLGRMHIIQEEPLMIVDSAHNEDGLKALFIEVEKIEYENLHIVFGMVSDKPLSKVLHLLPTNAKYYAVAADIPRAKAAITLHNELRDAGLVVKEAQSVEKGKNLALSEANPKDLVLVCGSIFVVAEIAEIALSLGQD
jgi:dihydrofolate synthase/folylpolyglutamate synthase